MRLPITPQLSTKEGTSNKNARLTNCLKESKKTGDKAVVRPGLVPDAQASGVGNGLVAFNGELVSVYGATLGLNTAEAAGSGVSVITDTIYAGSQTAAIGFMGGSEWLIGALNYDDEIGEIYLLDTSTDSTTIQTVPTIIDVMGIASNGTTTVIATRPGNFGGSASLIKATIGVWTFSTVTGLTSLDPYGIKFASNRYVAISSSGQTHWSTDGGTTWNEYALGSGSGREVLFDGTAWWFFGGDGGAVPNVWAYKTTDFVTFSLQSLTGLTANRGILSCAYAAGTYYMVLSSGSGLFSSSDGLSWALVDAAVTVVQDTKSGTVYAQKPTDLLYEMSGNTLVPVATTTFTGSYYRMDTNDDNSIVIGATLEPSVVRVDVSDGIGTIPALTTITGDFYDFAQSPL